jgi:hypothetical protein
MLIVYFPLILLIVDTQITREANISQTMRLIRESFKMGKRLL